LANSLKAANHPTAGLKCIVSTNTLDSVIAPAVKIGDSNKP